MLDIIRSVIMEENLDMEANFIVKDFAIKKRPQHFCRH